MFGVNSLLTGAKAGSGRPRVLGTQIFCGLLAHGAQEVFGLSTLQ